MKEILLTSSVLILALLILREVFREKISRQVQYALWGLVLLRLLIPVNLPAVDFSVLSAVEPARAQMEHRLEENPVYVLPVEWQEMSLSSEIPVEPTVILPIEGRHMAVTSEKGQPPIVTSYALSLEEALELGWIVGLCGMGVWLAVSNLKFWAMLRKKRIPLDLDCKYPVFLVEEGLVSPCLFGLVKPAVYLTPAALENEEGLRHVLAHEETHGRHGDPVWALLRGICLAVYWFDPLVWWAAAAAKEDCELACDEGALKRLGENERIPYGQTLLRLIPLQKSRGGVLLAATTMTSDKKQIKERIMRIAENKKMKTTTLCAMLAVVVCVCAVTFTGCTADAAAKPDQADVTAEPGKPDVPVSDLPTKAVGPENTADALTIPLTDLPAYEPVRIETLSAAALVNGNHHGEHDGHHGQQQHRVGGGCHTTENCGTFVWTYDGKTYVSSHDLRLSSFPNDYFLCIDNDYACVDESFTDILGYDGVMISYIDEVGSNPVETINDYYVFQDNGVYLLARVYGSPQLLDVNGDGINELVGTDGSVQAQIFFQRDGNLYEANIPELLSRHWGRWNDGSWQNHFFGWSEIHPQFMDVSGYIPKVREDGTSAPLLGHRQLYFDGENLYLNTPPERRITDHMLDGIQEINVVADAAKDKVKALFTSYAADDQVLWDDYCVTSITPMYMSEPGQQPDGTQLAVYLVCYSFHTPTPENVTRDEGCYIFENGWVDSTVSGAIGDKMYLVFRMLEDGSYHQLLGNDIPKDLPVDIGAF